MLELQIFNPQIINNPSLKALSGWENLLRQEGNYPPLTLLF